MGKESTLIVQRVDRDPPSALAVATQYNGLLTRGRIHGSRPVKVFNTATSLTNFHQEHGGVAVIDSVGVQHGSEKLDFAQKNGCVFVRVRLAFCQEKKH